ncbi:MAG: hypothetical protein FWD76_01225 [Firmicutes bacterium]|nr:hypothetical protein [Bacillota bacterium]
MDTKRYKYLGLFAELAKVGVSNEGELLAKFDAVMALSFDYGAEVWEYLCMAHEGLAQNNAGFSQVLGDKIFAKMYEENGAKTVKVVCDTVAIGKMVFGYNPQAASDLAQAVVAGWLTSGKYDNADYAMAMVAKNIRVDYTKYMDILVAFAISECMDKAKQTGSRPSVPKKMGEILTKFVGKLKGPDKARLLQRIKEIG